MSLTYRETFETSRELEFFSEKEFSQRIGYSRKDWLLILVKELIDNALDATDYLPDPKIVIRTGDDWISIQDNGSGLPLSVIEKALDYSIRVSDKNHYVSPSRGQLGNALKCLFAVGYVHGQGQTFVSVDSHGESHTIFVDADPISQTPRINFDSQDSLIDSGTIVKIQGDFVRWYKDHQGFSNIYNLIWRK